jgi:hypothetical protein
MNTFYEDEIRRKITFEDKDENAKKLVSEVVTSVNSHTFIKFNGDDYYVTEYDFSMSMPFSSFTYSLRRAWK